MLHCKQAPVWLLAIRVRLVVREGYTLLDGLQVVHCTVWRSSHWDCCCSLLVLLPCVGCASDGKGSIHAAGRFSWHPL
jgi:hypothetical protein